jgi:ABC-type cobalamin/Fe3+-siderophores transport system ATPase subunit
MGDLEGKLKFSSGASFMETDLLIMDEPTNDLDLNHCW